MLVAQKSYIVMTLIRPEMNETEEIRYIHSVQAQSLFDRVRLGAADKGMKLNPKKHHALYKCCSFVYPKVLYQN